MQMSIPASTDTFVLAHQADPEASASDFPTMHCADSAFPTPVGNK